MADFGGYFSADSDDDERAASFTPVPEPRFTPPPAPAQSPRPSPRAFPAPLAFGAVTFPSTRAVLWDRANRGYAFASFAAAAPWAVVTRACAARVATAAAAAGRSGAARTLRLGGLAAPRSAVDGAVDCGRAPPRVAAGAARRAVVFGDEDACAAVDKARRGCPSVDVDVLCAPGRRAPAHGPGGGLFSVAGACWPTSDGFRLRLECRVPDVTLKLCPLATPLPRLNTALDAALASHNGASLPRPPGADAAARSGFLTLDEARRCVFLLPSDPLVGAAPLVGVWVAGFVSESPDDAARDLAVLAAARDYLDRRRAKDVAVEADTCLVAVFVAPARGARASPHFYECAGRDAGGVALLDFEADLGREVNAAGPPAALLYAPFADRVASPRTGRPLAPRPPPRAAAPPAPPVAEESDDDRSGSTTLIDDATTATATALRDARERVRALEMRLAAYERAGDAEKDIAPPEKTRAPPSPPKVAAPPSPPKAAAPPSPPRAEAPAPVAPVPSPYEGSEVLGVPPASASSASDGDCAPSDSYDDSYDDDDDAPRASADDDDDGRDDDDDDDDDDDESVAVARALKLPDVSDVAGAPALDAASPMARGLPASTIGDLDDVPRIVCPDADDFADDDSVDEIMHRYIAAGAAGAPLDDAPRPLLDMTVLAQAMA